MNAPNAKHLLATTTAVLLWSGSFVGTRICLEGLGPLSLGFARFALAALAFVPVLAMRREPIPQGRDLVLVALSGLLGITLYFALENVGVMMTSAANASLVVGSFPAITIVLEALHERRMPSMRKLVGALVAFCGVAFISVDDGATGSSVLLGNVILVGAGVSWAVYNLVVRSLVGRVSAVALTGWQTIFGAVMFVPLALAEGLPPAMPSPPVLAGLAFLALGCSVAAYLLYNIGLERLSASTSVLLMNLVPVFGLVLSALILHEAITIRQLLGGAVIVCGIALGTATAGRRAETSHVTAKQP